MGEIIHREQFFLEKQVYNKMNQIMLEAEKEQEKKDKEEKK